MCTLFPNSAVTFTFILGHQDLPEEEELCDVQLQTVLFPLRNASDAV